MRDLGVIGFNEGNGHPYSYSAMFNGFDNSQLQAVCPFQLIKDYLPRYFDPVDQINGAKVSQIWTQNRQISDEIALVSKIPNVVESLEKIMDCHGVILARDDPWFRGDFFAHLFDKKTPFFIDKLISTKKPEIAAVESALNSGQLIMAASAARFTPQVRSLKNENLIDDLTAVHGVSPVSWVRYGNHLLEGLVELIGYDFVSAQSLSNNPQHDVVRLTHKTGIEVTFECSPKFSLPIAFTMFFVSSPPLVVTFDNFYFSFNFMMRKFLRMLETNVLPITEAEMLSVSKMIIAGMESKENGGKLICLDY